MIQVSHHPIYRLGVPEGHRFPMAKYELLPEQLIHRGIILPEQFHKPKPCSDDIILETHDEKFFLNAKLQKLERKDIRALGLPNTKELFEREMIITQGTIDNALFVLNNKGGLALNIAGGTHHAFFDRPEGFCLFNDFAVTSNYLLNRKLISKVLIVDLDVHQGNGTAALFEKNPLVFTFSMHGAKNYPFRKEKSDLDIPLREGTTGEEFLSILKQHLPRLIKEVKPDIMMYLAGVDVLKSDKFGHLGLELEDAYQRDLYVFQQAKINEIPTIVSMGGGYSPDIKTILDAHSATFKAAVEVFS